MDAGGISKAIFETDCAFPTLPPLPFPSTVNQNLDLTDDQIIRLCEICTEVGVAFTKTSTGYGFKKLESGDYNYTGATVRHLELIKKHVGEGVRIKAAGGVRTLDDLLRCRALGIARVGATATEGILEEAVRRGIGEERVEVKIKWEGFE